MASIQSNSNISTTAKSNYPDGVRLERYSTNKLYLDFEGGKSGIYVLAKDGRIQRVVDGNQRARTIPFFVRYKTLHKQQLQEALEDIKLVVKHSSKRNVAILSIRSGRLDTAYYPSQEAAKAAASDLVDFESVIDDIDLEDQALLSDAFATEVSRNENPSYTAERNLRAGFGRFDSAGNRLPEGESERTK